MKKILVTLGFCLMLLATTAQTASTLIEKAKLRLTKKDYLGALELVEKAITIGPDSANYHAFKAYCLFFTKQSKEAAGAAEEILTLFPNDYKVYYLVAQYFDITKDYYRNIEVYDEAFEKFADMPDTVKIRYYLLRSASKSNIMDYEGSHKDILEAYKLDTLNIDTWLSMALSLQLIDKVDESIVWYEKILKSSPANIQYYNNLGWLYDQTGHYTEAVSLLSKGIKLIDEKAEKYDFIAHGLLYSNRGFARYKLGDHKGALKDFENSIKVYSSNSYVYKNRALTYLAMKKNKEACADLYKAMVLGFADMYGNEVEKLMDAYCR